MMKFVGAGAAGWLIISAGLAQAGGLERNPLSLAPLYEDGRYFELSGSFVLPELSGDGGVIGPPFSAGVTVLSGNTGDLLDTYASIGMAYKADINDQLSYALILGQPLGADTAYPGPSAPPPDVTAVYGGSFADLKSYALTGLLAYDATPRVKLYGGPVLQTIKASAGLPFIPTPAGNGYEVQTNSSWGVGAVIGASYEIPEYALRVGLTYQTEIGHDFDTTETLDGIGPISSQTSIDTPQSLTLDFRTGIAADTLVFGQVRWVDWSEFNISPPNYPPFVAAGRALVDYSDDWTTYTLGLGRRFNENWSGAVALTYEPGTDTELTSLGPVDGRTGITLAATYEDESYKITGGLSYSRLGDTFNVLQTDYNGGEAIGIGIRFGWKL